MVIARQHLHKYATVLEPLLCSGLRATVEVLLETAFRVGLFWGCIAQLTELK
jgi:hypothetical protein